MKNSVDGNKSRYEKESTYPRHVYNRALFFDLFLQVLAKSFTNLSSLQKAVSSEKLSPYILMLFKEK